MAKTITKHCPYCNFESEVSGVSVREIPGYVNPITGKNTAMIERLSCSHEFVDGRFNIDAIYFSNPIPKSVEHSNVKIQIPQYILAPIHKEKNGFRFMDAVCLVCAIFLLFTVPPLTVIPIIYFVSRLIS